MQFLSQTDRIVYMDGGRILFNGSYASFVQTKFHADLQQTCEQEQADESAQGGEEAQAPPTQIVETKPTLLRNTERELLEEDSLKGRQFKRTLQLLRKYYGGFWLLFAIFLVNCVGVFFTYYATNYFFDFLSTDQFNLDLQHRYLRNYTIFLTMPTFLVWSRFAAVMTLSYYVSRRLLEAILDRLLHGDLCRFFDRIDLGRLNNRLSKDLNDVDKNFFFNLSTFFLMFALTALDVYVSAKKISPFVLILYALYAVVCAYFQNFYVRLRKNVARMEAVSASPLLSLVTEIIRGAEVFRVFGKTAQVFRHFQAKLFRNSDLRIIGLGMESWFQTRVTYFNILVVQLLSMLLIIFPFFDAITAKGLSIYISFLLNSIWNAFQLLRSLADLETSIVALERCDALTLVPSEKNYKNLPQNSLFLRRNIKRDASCFVAAKRATAAGSEYDYN